MKSFLEKIGEKYGNLNAEFATKHVPRGAQVAVILDGGIENLECVREAVALGKNRYRLKNNGRTWELRIPRERVLVRW